MLGCGMRANFLACSRSKMKQKLSITLDEELVNEIVKTLSTGKFRNKSHVVEYAVKKLLEVENGR